jgi:gas vesicle protein
MGLGRAERVGVFIAGALAGVVAGLLCAPQSGARTRRQIRKQARRNIEQLDELREDIRAQVDGWVHEITDVVDEGLRRGRRVTLAGREKVLAVLDEAKHRVEDGRVRVERLVGISETDR